MGNLTDLTWGTGPSDIGEPFRPTMGNRTDRTWGIRLSDLGEPFRPNLGNQTEGYGTSMHQGYESSNVANAGPQRPLLDHTIKPRYQQMRAFF